jgi:sigma-B regulation protein RsbU (phosphoserine phosphatase)
MCSASPPGRVRPPVMHSRGPDRRHTGPASVPLNPPGERRHSVDRRRHAFISQLQLFASLPYEAVERLLDQCAIRDYPAGAILLEPGQTNHALHLLISGRLRIHFDRHDSADYIAVEAGACVGELSVIDGRPVSAFVVADCDSHVLTVPETIFWEQLVTQPGVARNLLRELSERMRHNREIILSRVKDRLALAHLQKELSIAQDIQLAMLPNAGLLLRDRRDIDVHATMEPAKTVGGDFYDVFLAAPDRLLIAIGDVSGKGVPAALFMARTITQLRVEAAREPAPGTILEAANRALCESNEAGMFVTLFCGILDTTTGELNYANAGHNPPIFVDAAGVATFLPLNKGIVAGMVAEARYPPANIRLEPGQALLLYTDGVTEAGDPEDRFYTEERLLALMQDSARMNARELVDIVRNDVAAFSRDAPQADDITLLALRYHGGD